MRTGVQKASTQDFKCIQQAQKIVGFLVFFFFFDTEQKNSETTKTKTKHSETTKTKHKKHSKHWFAES